MSDWPLVIPVSLYITERVPVEWHGGIDSPTKPPYGYRRVPVIAIAYDGYPGNGFFPQWIVLETGQWVDISGVKGEKWSDLGTWSTIGNPISPMDLTFD